MNMAEAHHGFICLLHHRVSVLGTWGVQNSVEWVNQSQQTGNKETSWCMPMKYETVLQLSWTISESLLLARTSGDFCKLINWTFNSLFSCTVYSIYISNYWICMYKWMQLQSLRYFFSLDLLNLNQKIGLQVMFGVALRVNHNHNPAPYIWIRLWGRSLRPNKLIGFEMHEILFYS